MRALWFSTFPLAERRPWNFHHLSVAFVITFMLQMVILPCLCAQGGVKTQLGGMLDFLVLIRVLIAWVLREKGNTWIFYAVLLYTSPFWITFWVESVWGR